MKQWLTFINKPSTQANLVFSFFYFGLISALGWFYSNSLIFTISNQPPINLPTQPPTLKSLNFCLIWLIFLQLTSSMLQSFWSFVMLISTGNGLGSNCPGYICQGNFWPCNKCPWNNCPWNNWQGWISSGIHMWHFEGKGEDTWNMKQVHPRPKKLAFLLLDFIFFLLQISLFENLFSEKIWMCLLHIFILVSLSSIVKNLHA